MTGFRNANLVLPDRLAQGGVAIENGVITAIEDHEGVDLEGDFLLPGLIDLHTDNLERQVLPRSNARWPSRSAFLSHDAQCAAAGVTTVFDALCLGDIGFEKARAKTFADGLADLKYWTGAGMLKTQHFLHLRCELPAPEMPELLAMAIDDPLVRLVSLMDHSPGLGQYADIAQYRAMRAADGYTAQKIDDVVEALQENHRTYHARNRALVRANVSRRGIPLASHDDREQAEIARNFAEGIAISEFPMTASAARAARNCGMSTIAGAPNIVRGGSHNGNVAVLDLIREGLLDALASDYVPAAMLEAAFICVGKGVLDLPAAVRLITAGPASMVGLDDRGRIAPGLRADFLQVRVHDGLPVIRSVWREGVRIA